MDSSISNQCVWIDADLFRCQNQATSELNVTMFIGETRHHEFDSVDKLCEEHANNYRNSSLFKVMSEVKL